MTTVTNTIAAKFFGAFAVVALTLSLFAPAVNAQTESDLQQMINDLLAQVASLQSQLGQDGATGSSDMAAGVCPYTWTRDLSTGATGMDVMKLQQFLNADADTRVAATGVGSAGMETEYFGGLTAAAVSKFQVKYRAQVLSPLGLVNPTGYFGAGSRAHANNLCHVSVPSEDDDATDDDATDDDDATEDDDDDSSDDSLSGGEADVQSYDDSSEQDEVAEGEEDVAVYSVEFDVEDGDVRLERLDVRFDSSAITASGESDPWDAFDEISIWIDGEKVASEDVSDEDDWDENVTTDVDEFRFTGIDSIFREDTTGEVIIAVSAASNLDIDGGAGNDDWTVFIPANGFRFVDSLGLDVQGPSSNMTGETFEMIEEGDNDDLDLTSSSENPDATTLEVDDDNNKEYAIFAFELDADDSDNDIDLDNLYIDVSAGGAFPAFDTPGELVDDFRIEIDGESFDAESWTGTSSSSPAVVQFDIDGDFTIEAGEAVNVVLYADFNDVSTSFTSATISAAINATQADIDAEGADDLTTIGGSTKTGNTHTLRQSGIVFGSEPTDGTGSSDSTQVTSASAVDDNYGTMFLEFEITVFGEDLWVPIETATEGVADTTSGLTYEILKSGTATSTNFVAVVDWDIEGADEDSGYYELEDGQTYTVVVNVESLNPEVTGLYSFRVNSLGYNETEDTTPNASATPDDTTEYVSDAVSIQS